MGIKTNELQKVNAIVGTDSIVADTDSEGTARVPFDVLSEFLRGTFLTGGAGGVPYGKELTEDWATLRSRIQAGNFDGIHIGDYKEITLTGGEQVVMEVAGIDQYYQCGDTPIGHHIDFISRDCLAGARMFNKTDGRGNTNNGTQAEPNPWRASDLFQDMNNESSGVFSKLPQDLKNCIIEKRALLESRYSATAAIDSSTGWAWNNMGKLWIPTEREVWGTTVWSEESYSGGGGCNLQYPIFMGGAKHIIKGDGKGGARCYWWEASAHRASATGVCGVAGSGYAGNHAATYAAIRVPLCFRIG